MEWSERITELIPEEAISVRIKKNTSKGFDYRQITLEGVAEDIKLQ